MKTSWLNLFVVLIFATSTPAFACGGGTKTTYNVNFATDAAPGALAITLTNPSTGQSNQYLDDDGFLSVHVATTYLFKTATNAKGNLGKISLVENESTVHLIKDRLGFHRKFIEEQNLNRNLKRAWISRVDDFARLLSSPGPIDAREMWSAFSEISVEFYKFGGSYRYSKRASAADPWSDPIQLIKLSPSEIPTGETLRGGCNDGLALNSSIRNSQASPSESSLPSFTIEGTK